MSELRVVTLIVALAIAMGICAALGTRHRLALVVLALLSLVWLIVDQSFEGPNIWHIDAQHGVTFADLFGFAGFALAIGLWVRLVRRR